MKLQDFITETLIQISNGVKEANCKTDRDQVQINPYLIERWFSGSEEKKSFIGLAEGNKLVQTIDFDISVTVEDEQNKGGTIMVVSSIVGLGLWGKQKNSEKNISKIRFSIPIALPQSHEK